MDAVAWAARSEEQRELAAAVAELAADRCDSAHRRAVLGTDPYWDPELWRALAVDIGLAGIAIPERYGGAGGDFTDAAVVIEESARALLPVPATAHLAAAEAIRLAGAADDESLGESLSTLACGSAVGALGVATEPGRASRVPHGHTADLLVVATDAGLFLVEAGEPDVSIGMRPSLDLTRPNSDVRFDPSAHRPIGDADAAGRAVDVLRVCLAIEAVGVARAALDATVGYLKVREQFGRPIGSFQALQHRVADLAVDLEAAVSCARYAASVVAAAPGDEGELAVVAPLAKALCADAAWRIAAESIQLHGGIGFTWEHDAHLYFKLATALRALLGSPVQHRRLVATRAGLTGA